MNTHLLQEIYSLAAEAKDYRTMLSTLETAMAYDIQLTPNGAPTQPEDPLPFENDDVNYVEADIADLIRYILTKGN